MPNHYQFSQPNGEAQAAWFDLAQDGSLVVPDGGFITADTDADGHARVNFVGFPIALDATLLATSNIYFRLSLLTDWLLSANPLVLNLMPNHYLFGQPNGDTPLAVFEVTSDGQLLVPKGGFITADVNAAGQRRVNFNGFAVLLDATALTPVNPYFRLQNLTEWMPASQTQVLNLMPNRYAFGQPDIETPAVVFDIGASGNALVPAGGFIATDMTAAGQRRVTFTGHAVTLDATAVASTLPSFRLQGLDEWLPTPAPRKLNLMPASYLLTQPSAIPMDAAFDIDTYGAVQKPANAGISFGSLAGISTATVRLLGHRITIEAPAVASQGLSLIGVETMFDSDTALHLPLVPGRYQLRLASGPVTEGLFDVEAGGVVRYDPASPGPGTFMRGAGTDTLTLTGFAITIDATQLSNEGFALVDTTSVLRGKTRVTLRLLPGSYQFATPSEPVEGLTFDVHSDGTVGYADMSPGSQFRLQGAGSASITVIGSAAPAAPRDDLIRLLW